MSTRISDLPMHSGNPVQQPNMDSRSSVLYSHPNPYGAQPGLNSQADNWLKSRDPREEMTNQDIRSIVSQYPSQQIPSKDIQYTTGHHTHDVETTPNYIPPPKISSDFVKEYENKQHQANYEKYKYRKTGFDILIDNFKIPAMVSIIFFFFQMPLFKRLLFNYATFLFGEDGEFTVYGRIIISVFFGFIYKNTIHFIDILAEPM